MACRCFLIAIASSLLACDREPTPSRSAPSGAAMPIAQVDASQRIPEGAQELRIHRELKLPYMAKGQGDYCLRDRESFTALLGKVAPPAAVGKYEEWNGIDFARQMALVAVEEHSSGGDEVRIQGVWQSPSEILVDVLDIVPDPGTPVTMAFTYPWASAVVNRSKLPVRFLRRRQTWTDAKTASR